MPDMFWYIWCAVGIPWGLITLVLIPQKTNIKEGYIYAEKNFINRDIRWRY